VKKFLVLLLVPLLISAAFAGNFVLSQTAKLDLQINILSAINYLKITPTQAASIAQSMEKFKVAVNSLENNRIKDLTMLRDALVKNDEMQISVAKKMIEELDKKYAKTALDFANSIKSIVTLEQAERAKAFFEHMRGTEIGRILSEKLPFLRRQIPFMNQIGNEEKPKPVPHVYGKKREMGGKFSARQPMQKGFNKPQLMRPMPQKLTGIERFDLAVRKAEFIHSLVNSDLYSVVLKTLELKAK